MSAHGEAVEAAQVHTVIRLLRALATGSRAKEERHDVIFTAAADMLLALSQQAEGIRAEWMPIETAPKDGTRLLLVGKVYAGLPFVGVWSPTDFNPAQPWLNAISITRLYEHVPTHWMPLPPPPSVGD